MELRLAQLTQVLIASESCDAVADAIDEGMEVLYGGLRPLPSRDLLDPTLKADAAVRENEMSFARTLEAYAMRGKCAQERGRALDLKLFVEQMSEVARAAGEIARQCGDGSELSKAPCDELQRLLDTETGHELLTGVDAQAGMIGPSYSVSLRSPFVLPWAGGWEEDVVATSPIARGECVVIPKETRGLMVRLHYERMTVVRDPWVSVFGYPRGTVIPIWSMEWVPSEYVKRWNICNVGGAVQSTVTQQVKQDIPLDYFWRFYPKTR